MCFRRILTIHPPIPEDLSVDVKDFINQLLVKDPSKRLGGGLPDAEELKHHPFFAVSLLLSLSIRWLVSLIQDQWIRTERRNQKESGEQEMTNEIQSVMFLFIYSRTDLSFLISLKKAQETMDGPNYENWNAKGLILECLFCCVSFPLFFLSLSLSFLSLFLSPSPLFIFFIFFYPRFVCFFAWWFVSHFTVTELGGGGQKDGGGAVRPSHYRRARRQQFLWRVYGHGRHRFTRCRSSQRRQNIQGSSFISVFAYSLVHCSFTTYVDVNIYITRILSSDVNHRFSFSLIWIGIFLYCAVDPVYGKYHYRRLVHLLGHRSKTYLLQLSRRQIQGNILAVIQINQKPIIVPKPISLCVYVCQFWIANL